jgi:hypothetical protein
MQNWEMWLAAIIINIFIGIIYWKLNPIGSNQMDFRGVYLILILLCFNLIVGISIVIYTALKGNTFEGHPFLILSMVLLLIIWRIRRSN